MQTDEFIDPLVNLAEDAGRAIMEVYATDFDVQSKADASPVTEADLAAHRLIAAGLGKLRPDIPVLSEEDGLPPYAERAVWSEYWLVDPLDGTKEFVKRNGEFTVNIALIRSNRPVLGVVHVPVQRTTYVGCEGHGAELRRDGATGEPLCVTSESAKPPRVAGSRSHPSDKLAAFLEELGEHELVPMGSSLKFCRVAEGQADVYPRLGPTSEWDTAAAQAVVECAGGSVLELDGQPLRYNAKDNILNPHFVVFGPNDRDWLALIANAE